MQRLRILVLIALLWPITGCRDEPVPPPQFTLPPVPEEPPVDAPPPDDPASEAECQHACARVAALAERGEVAALSALHPGLLPESSQEVRRDVQAAVRRCVPRCRAQTPAAMARCVAAATGLSEVDRCLDFGN